MSPHPEPNDYQPLSCRACAKAATLGFDYSMAFQPIANAAQKRVMGYEALARGLGGEPAGTEYQHLRDFNFELFQGYLFARPAFESLPEVQWPE